MKKSERGPASFDDAQFEKLLQDFFAHEMPPDLANANVALAESRAGETASRSGATAGRSGEAGRSVSWTMPALAALAIGLSACVLWFAASPHGDREPVRPAPKDFEAEWGFARAAASPSPVPVSYFLSQDVKPVESLRYDTLHGVVEQRTNLNTTSVSFIEPETGDLLELTLPELVIEIFPIDDQRPAEPSGTSAGKRGAGEPDVTPPTARLPEEG